MRSRASRNTKVLNGFAGVALSAKKQSGGTSGGANSKLVKSEGLTTSLDDAGASSLGETEGGNGHLGDDGHALIVGDSTNEDSDKGLLAGTLGDILGDGREGHDGSVGARHTQTLQDDLVEGRISATGKEAIELDKKLDISILAGGSLTNALLNVMLGNVNTLKEVVRFCSFPNLQERMDVKRGYGNGAETYHLDLQRPR